MKKNEDDKSIEELNKDLDDIEKVAKKLADENLDLTRVNFKKEEIKKELEKIIKEEENL